MAGQHAAACHLAAINLASLSLGRQPGLVPGTPPAHSACGQMLPPGECTLLALFIWGTATCKVANVYEGQLCGNSGPLLGPFYLFVLLALLPVA